MATAKTAKTVRFYESGGADVLRLEDLPIAEPGAGEVRVRVQAIGLNRAEVMYRQGQYLERPQFPSRIGVEAAGVIEALGSGVTNVSVGERVWAFPTNQSQNGVYGEVVICPAVSVFAYPPNLTPVQAAAAWMQYATTYFHLVEAGHLRAGQHVLITAASSSTGLAAIEMARLRGAKSIATTRSAAKRQGLLDASADYVIVTGEENLSARVMEITNGTGAELIFDPVAGKTLEALADSVAWGGTILLYGVLDDTPTVYPIMQAFTRNFSLRAPMVYNYIGHAAHGLPRNDEAFARGYAFISDALRDGKLDPVIARTFPLAQIQDAHRYMESNAQLGKIVVTVE